VDPPRSSLSCLSFAFRVSTTQLTCLTMRVGIPSLYKRTTLLDSSTSFKLFEFFFNPVCFHSVPPAKCFCVTFPTLEELFILLVVGRIRSEIGHLGYSRIGSGDLSSSVRKSSPAAATRHKTGGSLDASLFRPSNRNSPIHSRCTTRRPVAYIQRHQPKIVL
jgi:hypothetical protein